MNNAYKKGCETYLRKRGAFIMYPKPTYRDGLPDAIVMPLKVMYAAIVNGNGPWALMPGDELHIQIEGGGKDLRLSMKPITPLSRSDAPAP